MTHQFFNQLNKTVPNNNKPSDRLDFTENNLLNLNTASEIFSQLFVFDSDALLKGYKHG